MDYYVANQNKTWSEVAYKDMLGKLKISIENAKKIKKTEC